MIECAVKTKKIMRGFALLELLVAVAVLSVTFTSIYGATQLAKKALRVAGDRMQAAFLLEESNEALRHIRDEGWAEKIQNLKLNPYPPWSFQAYCLDFGTENYGLTDWLSNFWRFQFDESAGVGVFKDSSIYQRTGTCTGTSCPTSGVLARFGNAITFDGVDDYLTILDFTVLTEYTIEAWIKPAVNTDNKNIIVRGDSGGPIAAYSTMLRTITNIFAHWTRDSGFKQVVGTTLFNPGVWYHVVGTAKNNNFMRLYVDGTEEGTPVAIGTLWNGDRYYMGSNAFFANYFNGDVDSIALYAREFSADEVAERYAAGPPCRIIDNKFSLYLNFRNACRNNSSQDITSDSISAGGVSCGTGGTVNADTKIATTTISWSGYLEQSAIYLTNMFKN